MWVVGAVGAGELSVAAGGGLVRVSVVFVVDGEFAETLAGEFAAASPAYVWENGERPFAVSLLTKRLLAPGIGNDLCPFFGIGACFLRGHLCDQIFLRIASSLLEGFWQKRAQSSILCFQLTFLPRVLRRLLLIVLP